MSLFGIDMGSSSVKISAYTEDGKLLAVVNNLINPIHEKPGWWETNPDDVWNAAKLGLRELSRLEVVRKDPPKAMAISASGRENFPADKMGNPLGNTLMGADIRGQEFEIPPTGTPIPEAWTLSCGHPRERMDPVLRLLWWRKNHPEIIEQARSYPDWHGFLTLRLCGRNVSERSLVGRWAVYDLTARTWSQERLTDYNIEPHFLPEVLEWGEAIGKIKPELARELELPDSLLIVNGGHDLNCAGIGAGISRLGSACLISGSYENMLIPTEAFPSYEMLSNGLSITPHLGSIERSVYAICPTGNAVLNWARETTHLSIDDLAIQLSNKGTEPGPIMALPYFSGMMLYGNEGRKLRGVLAGLTLSSSSVDIVQAFMESIAYDNRNTLALLQKENIPVDNIRATGGGTRSEWWTQLKSDVMGVPIAVSSEPEPGTLGAALLAGIGIGVFKNLEEACQIATGTSRIYEPDQSRAMKHQERMNFYQNTVNTLLKEVFSNWPQ
jgi:sugar (pentulose or hexulose) kinase